MRRLPYLLLTLLCLAGCNQPFWTPKPPPEPVPYVPPSSSQSITTIVLTRSPCLGTCPHYEVTLRQDGSVRYAGKTHAPRPGTYIGRWEPDSFAALASAVLRNGFYAHEELPWAFDVPVTRICVSASDSDPLNAIVAGQFEDHHYLWSLARQIDSIASHIVWSQVSDSVDMYHRGCAG
jgi:hypothetical protein